MNTEKLFMITAAC